MQYLDINGVRTLWGKVKSAVAAGASQVSINSSAAGAFAGFSMQTIVHNAEGEDGHVEYKLSLTDVQSASALRTILADYVTDNDLSTLEGKVNALVGSDTAKSARVIAREEIAAQLIPEEAQEALDTLQEIADWIQSHPSEVTAINTAILNLQSVTALPDEGQAPASGTIAKYAYDLVDAEQARATGEEARIEKILTEVEDPNVAGSKDGVLKRLDTLEESVGTPTGGDISTQIRAVQEAIEDLDWTITAEEGKVIKGFEIVNGRLRVDSVEKDDMPTKISSQEINEALV
jgi:hypothetical protein